MAADPDDDTLAAPDTAVAGSAHHPVLDRRYEILGLLGSGGMGNVYKARDLELDEIIALKVLRPELVGAPGAIDRFRREVKLARRITHPNVGRVFDIGEHGGDKIITMALIDGEALSTVLARERLVIARAVEIASGICAGVGAAHAAGVVHRDLKPDNVMIEKGGAVIVMDFGIARAAAASDAARSFAGLVGTPAYMAPEQVDDRAAIDTRADIYAFGVMLYEMLTGELPWRGDSVIAVAAARLLHPPPDPRSARADLPPALAAIVLRCMAKSPDDRFSNMQDVVSVLAGLTMPAESPGAKAMLHASPAIDVLPHVGVRRVAVLPFRNRGAPEEEHVADGLTEDLIDLLSAGRKLRVTSRGVVMKYKGIERDPREIGRELDVNVVVEGSVRRAPGSFLITARLVSVADGFQLWARRFKGVEVDMLALNDEVAQAVAEALAVDLDAEKRGAVADLEAADLYLRGRAAFRRFLVEESDEDATSLFEKALARTPNDPRIIAAYVMARVQIGRATGSRDTSQPTSFAQLASGLQAQAEVALRAAPTLADAHVALGYLTFQMGDEVAAMTSLRRGVLLAPNSADAHDVLGRILSEADRKEGLRHLQTAITLEPGLDKARVALARHHYLAGDRDLATSTLESSDKHMFPIRARLCLWSRDRELAKELLSGDLGNPSPTRSVSVGFLELIAGGGKLDLSSVSPPAASISPRLNAFFSQIRAEIACVGSDYPRAIEEIVAGERGALFDIAWLTRCPLLAPLQNEPEVIAARARMEARVSRIVAAYVTPFE